MQFELSDTFGGGMIRSFNALARKLAGRRGYARVVYTHDCARYMPGGTMKPGRELLVTICRAPSKRDRENGITISTVVKEGSAWAR
jgi:hypothetical protein